jgi:hypothetical protein
MEPSRLDVPEAVVVYASIRGLLAAVGTPVLLGLLTWRALVVAGPTTGSMTFGGITVAITLAVLLQIPRHAVFDGAGITRVCLGRRHHLPWGRLTAIERARPTQSAILRNLSGGEREVVVSGGLLARGSGRRRWMLTDQIESRDEYERIEALLRACGNPAELRAPRPHEGALPTDLYRPGRT